METIEKRLQGLQAKGAAVRFLDKGEDGKEVARVIQELQDAISHYQVSGYQGVASNTVDMRVQISQQQAMYDEQQAMYKEQQVIYEEITGLAVRILWLVLTSRPDGQFCISSHLSMRS